MSEPLPPDQGPPVYETPTSPKGPSDWIPIVALILGCLNVLSWCLPLCGCPVGIAGIVFGVLGLKSNTRRGMAKAGLIMSVISMLFTLVNAGIGAWMYFNHKGVWAPHP